MPCISARRRDGVREGVGGIADVLCRILCGVSTVFPSTPDSCARGTLVDGGNFIFGGVQPSANLSNHVL